MFKKINNIVRVLEDMLYRNVAHAEILAYVQQNFGQIRLDTLNIEVSKCTSCENSGFPSLGTGPVDAPVMFIAEFYADDIEDILDKLIRAAQERISPLWNLKDIYITYLIKCKDQNLTHKIIANCKKFVEEEIKLVNPSYIVCFGQTVCDTLIHPKFDLYTEQFKEFGSTISESVLLGTHKLVGLDKVGKEERITAKKDILHTMRFITDLQQG